MPDIDSNLPVRELTEGENGDTAPTVAEMIGGIDGNGDMRFISTDTSGRVNIANVSGTVSLPTGAATAALQSDILSRLILVSGRLGVNVISNGGGVQGALTVGTSAVELRVGGSALANRVNATLYNNSNRTIYWGYTNAVTTSTGTPIQKDQAMTWDVGPSTAIWLIAGSANNNTRITEAAA